MNKTVKKETFEKEFRKQLVDRDITIVDLGKRAGVSPTYICKILKNPDVRTFRNGKNIVDTLLKSVRNKQERHEIRIHLYKLLADETGEFTVPFNPRTVSLADFEEALIHLKQAPKRSVAS